MQYLSIRKHDSPSLTFSFMDWILVSRHLFYRTSLISSIICNLNLHNYQAHGFRIGAATTAAAQGLLELKIQNIGRWKTNA